MGPCASVGLLGLAYLFNTNLGPYIVDVINIEKVTVDSTAGYSEEYYNVVYGFVTAEHIATIKKTNGVWSIAFTMQAASVRLHPSDVARINYFMQELEL